MKKQMPNILLVIIVLVNLLFMSMYVGNNGLGRFISTTGVVFLAIGVVVFIFFLSIDPGYGWVKSIDLRKNYILIFTSLAICMVGAVLIVIGQHRHELHLETLAEVKRCQGLQAGNVAEVLKKDWYSLRDRQIHGALTVYLFQKKSNRNNYKIVASVNSEKSTQELDSLTISSETIPQPLSLDWQECVCPGVFEKDVSIDFERNQQLNQQVQFDLLMTMSEDVCAEPAVAGSITNIQLTLQNQPVAVR